MNENVIALDGPAGSGKSTVARQIAEKIGFNYLDTGAFYRALTLFLFRKYQAATNAGEFSEWVKTDEAKSSIGEAHILCEFSAGNENKILLGGEDVSLAIRTPEITKEIKHIANQRIYRDFVNKELHSLAKRYKLIMDGRDIGTEVFPDAKFKFYLTASSKVRAERRYLQLQEQGIAADRDEIEREIILRDRSDMEREIAPLYQANDAILIDTDLLPKNSVISKILEILDR
ncbi:(d)CMP kinase [Leptospira yasudae]|uniref:Cytidylate kinase n=1 Tax=Leptospira yasudae TaxID=2202201 RepID=A0A6N4QGR1_9LEPT|nr:(d)CMP kinase [Leptospira yasudae]TGL78878.1 (d)CMP kinase [Leptospira yasudae]TGL79778.1 (d)CMP kinase [Leptospira yasudae]TGL85774.1 (d)CMP kinase [Leptospira yasudae]